MRTIAPALPNVRRGATLLALFFAGCHSTSHAPDAAAPDIDAGVDLAVQLGDLPFLPPVDSAMGLVLDPDGSYPWPAFGPIFAPLNGQPGSNAVPFKPEGCNSVAYGTTPELGTSMVGRILNADTAPNHQCFHSDMGTPIPNVWSLSWVQMSWSASTVTFQYRILDTQTGNVAIEGGAHSIFSAYDATVADFAGEHWVAFECGVNSGTVSACVGPLSIDPTTGNVIVDTLRTSIAVHGVTASPLSRGATVPKLVVLAGSLYLYWGDLTFNTDGSLGNSVNAFVSVDTRGVQLSQDVTTGRMYPAGTFGSHAPSAIASNDPSSVLVMPNADWKQVINVGGNLIATGNLAQLGKNDMTSQDCITPIDQVPNCWRVFFAQSKNPLEAYGNTGAFTLVPSEADAPTDGLATIATTDGIPSDPGTYNRFVYRADTAKNTELMGGSFFTALPAQTQTSYTFAWPDNLFTAPISCPTYPGSIVFDGTCWPARSTSIANGKLSLAVGACVSAGGAKLCMQATGNLVAFDAAGTELWGTEMLQSFDAPANSGPNQTLAACPGCVAKFQGDGNLVLYDGANKAYWSSRTGVPGSMASLHLSHTPPYVSVHDVTGYPIFDRFPAGYRLYAGECTTLGATTLCMKTTGELVFNDGSTPPLWSSTSFTSNDVGMYTGTTADFTGCSGCYASFGTDGNLTLVGPGSTGTYWATGAAGAGATLSLSMNMPHVAVFTSTGTLYTPSGW